MNNENKTNITWFPGHMTKTRRQITEDLKLVDVVIEILDARIPKSSQNPEIRDIIKDKKRIIVLNKSDLADENDNNLWKLKFKQQGIEAVLVNSNSGKGIDEVLKLIQKIMEEELQKLADKGRTGRKIRAMIVGIPNVGKSSFINRIAKKNSAIVGNRPGVTKAKQWIRINEQIELLDTPGVLWPKFESNEVALNLAFTGTIKDNLLEIIEVAYSLTKFLIENYRERFLKRYKLDDNEVNEILNNKEQEENQNIYEIMQLIGKKRGAIMSGGYIDDEKTSKIIIEDFRTGKLGRITIEKC